jgi:hypothetical protein
MSEFVTNRRQRVRPGQCNQNGCEAKPTISRSKSSSIAWSRSSQDSQPTCRPLDADHHQPRKCFCPLAQPKPLTGSASLNATFQHADSNPDFVSHPAAMKSSSTQEQLPPRTAFAATCTTIDHTDPPPAKHGWQKRAEAPVMDNRRGTALAGGGLPVEVTSFVGRAREIEEARRLLGAARLVTLIGAGGVGKTRLALRLAYQVSHGQESAARCACAGSLWRRWRTAAPEPEGSWPNSAQSARSGSP